MNTQMVSDIVVALLTGTEVDGETMQDIIKKVGMQEQMLRQLVVNAEHYDLKVAIENRNENCPIFQQVYNSANANPEIDVVALAEKIVEDVIDNIDADDLVDYDLTMSGREVVLRSVSFDNRMMKRQITDAIKEYIHDLKE